MRVLGTVADVHVTNAAAFGGVASGRRNDRCRAVEDCLAASIAEFAAICEPGDPFVVAGDLFDNDHPFPDQMRVVGNMMKAHPEIHFVVVLGNHDMHSTMEWDNALAPLSLLANVTVAMNPYHIPGTDVAVLPYHVSVLDYTPPAGVTVVIGHHGIADDKTAPFLRSGKGVVEVKNLVVWMQMHGLKHYIAGDWHEHRKWQVNDCTVVQVGALCPTGWNNPGHTGYGSLICITDGVYSRIEIKGPRFIHGASREDVLKEVLKAKRAGNTPYVKAACPAFEDPALEGAYIDWAPAIVKAQGAVRVAAEHLKSATTLQECFHSYVEADDTIPQEMKADVLRTIEGLMG